jgi:hypothetical protein
MHRKVSRVGPSVAAIAGALLVASNASAELTVEAVSSHPDLVSGSSVLISVEGALGPPQVTFQRIDMSDRFRPDENNPGRYLGLISGLVHGKNPTIEVFSGRDSGSIRVINHSEPTHTLFVRQQFPFVCELESFDLAPVLGHVTGARPGRPEGDLTGVENPLSASCFASTVVQYYYKSTGDEWLPYDPFNRPDDIATTTIDGNEVSLIVRQERGVLNRAGYVINILHDPDTGPAPTYGRKGGSAWNGKLIYSVRGGVRAGYHQGRNLGALNANAQWMEEGVSGALDAWITRGYAVAADSLSVAGNTLNDVVSAETMYRVKERFIKAYGPPIYTVSTGFSGGGAMQNLIANAYPGILDGIIPHIMYSDYMTFLQPLEDCDLLVNVFNEGDWTREKMQAVAGAYWGFCVSNASRYPTRDPSNCDTVVLTAIEQGLFTAEDVRCTFQDDLLQIFSVDPETGFARNPFDNVGVQYGLQALNDGVISMDEFIDINTRVGGHDFDGNIVAERQVGDEEALRVAYGSGRIVQMTGGLAAIPQVHTRDFREADYLGRGDPNVDVHDRFPTTVHRARLEKYLGTTGTAVYLQVASEGGPLTPGEALNLAHLDALDGIDRWIMAIKADTSDRSLTEKVVANRPADLVDTCYTYAGQPYVEDRTGIEVQRITDRATCDEIFPQYSHPRIVAGGPLTEDIFKCQLKPVDVSDYSVAPTADQMARLQAAFPEGVCDYTKPGVGQTELTTWAIFEDDGVYRGL